ncbi:MAG TPA: S46 family peptidase [Bacteroidales bacterium]|nr:S46 family peptidase [Bacteroidales bacterium]
MKMSKLFIKLGFLFVIGFTPIYAQQTLNPDTIQAGAFDMGKMWAFDYPPLNYFAKTYNFSPNAQWFEKARLSALRFANYCSASFVSENGLVMTNHHCARESGFEAQKPGENFNANGFYAKKITDERRVNGLYVEQLQKIEDITERVQKAMSQTQDKSAQLAARTKEFEAIIAEYKNKEEWKGLILEPMTFYSGGKYALHGFKRYNDVRLVFMPELNLGFFGGDYDNFTYPRYDLDCSFFRVYDDNGQPLKTTNYFKFNSNPITENEPVFIIGNPGSTGRLWTISDLEYRRDITLPFVVSYLKKRSQILQEYNKKAKKDSLINEIFSFENSIKAYGGELDGLLNPYLMARKVAFERNFKADVQKKTDLADKLSTWNEIDQVNTNSRKFAYDNLLFSGNSNLTGQTFAFALNVSHYLYALQNNRARAVEFKRKIGRIAPPNTDELDQAYLAAYLSELKQKLGNDPIVAEILGNQDPTEVAKRLLNTTQLKTGAIWNKLASGDSLAIAQLNDPLLNIAKLASDRYLKASAQMKINNERLSIYWSELGHLIFELYGTNYPPDATFSLRIADGIVKGYNYNGTKAPYKTTFYGLYDRYYSFPRGEAWDLPKRWLNPAKELLPITMNFVSTNDIIGGNSGSPVINKNLEVVGLVFDGNMESLPGRFIYIPDANRSVSVSAEGMLGALKYIYKASRLQNELEEGK